MKENNKQFQYVVDSLIAYLRFRENEQKRGEDELWGKIEREIGYRKKASVKSFLYWGAAAIVVFLFSSVVYFLIDDTDSLDKCVAELDEPVLETSQIQIYLSSEEKVMLAENKVSVIYSSTGEVSINEEVRETISEKKVKPVYNQIVVPKGKYTHLILSDGSTVHINSGTRVVYPRVFSGNCREIYVEGEVCLDVVKNEKTPFVVKTPQFEVEVLGTLFNVNAYKEDEKGEVVLVNGSVRLSDKHRRKVELKPNQLAAVKEGHVGKITSVEASDYIAWTQGVLVLNLAPLSEMFKKLERFYGQNITVSEDAGTLLMKGKVDLHQSLDDLIVLISATAPITYEKKDGNYYINKRE